jgi:GDPmannose 4,6-dehydratase
MKRGTLDVLMVGNLSARRDWGFAGDYVRAMWMALQRPEPEDVVVATGIDHSVRDLVRTAFEVAEIEGWEALVKAEKDEPELWSPADPARARDDLGWVPEVDFEALVRMMVRHDLATP